MYLDYLNFLPSELDLLSSGTNSFVEGDNVADIPSRFHFWDEMICELMQIY